AFEGLVPPLHLPIALRVIWRRSDMCHTADADELLEVPGDELRPVVRDDQGPRVGEPLARPLDDRLDFGFGHALPDLPVDDESTVAVEEAAEVEERPGDIDVRDINMPVLVGPQGLLKARPFERWFAVMYAYQTGVAEDAVDARGADGDDLGVEHHE